MQYDFCADETNFLHLACIYLDEMKKIGEDTCTHMIVVRETLAEFKASNV